MADQEPRARGGGWSAEPRIALDQQRALSPAPRGGPERSHSLQVGYWGGATRRSRSVSRLGARATLGQGDLKRPPGHGRDGEHPVVRHGQSGAVVAGLHSQMGARGETPREWGHGASPASRGMMNAGGGVGTGTDGLAKEVWRGKVPLSPTVARHGSARRGPGH